MGSEEGRGPADDKPAPLPDNVPALRMEVHGRTITEASPAAGALLGLAPGALVGRPFTDLLAPSERSAVNRRLDDVVLLGRDAFGALALQGAGASAVLVEVNAHYVYKRGQRVEMALRRLERPPPPVAEVEEEPAPADPPAPEDAAVEEGEPSADDDDSGNIVDEGADSVDEGADSVDEGAPPPPPAPDPVLAPVPPPHSRGALLGGRSTAPERSTSGELGLANAHVAELGLEGATTALAIGALDSAGVAALAVAPDGTVSSATTATEARLGRPIARVRGTHLADLFDFPSLAAAALVKARDEGLRQSVLANLAGSEVQVFLDWVPGPTARSGVVLLGTGEAGRARPAQSDAERMQARLLSFVAHDVRECVVAVTMGIETVKGELGPDSPLEESVERALKESRRAYTIIDDLLLVTRPGCRERIPLQVGAILADTVDRLAPKARDRGIELVAEVAPDVEVPADLSNLERALANLVENALQATAFGGRVTISTVLEERLHPGVRVSVADTGAGIAPDIQPNIFEPFVTNKPTGSGLGLAIVRRVVLDHGGQIDYDTAEGRGTTFHVWLPRAV